MSEQQLKAFLAAVKADAGLQEKLKAACDAEAVVAIAKAADFVISADQLKQAQSEISEEQMEGVIGGVVAAGDDGGLGADVNEDYAILTVPLFTEELNTYNS